MDKVTYPTGVENHGGTLRIWFSYKGKRVRESLGVPDTIKNRKIAGELRTAVCFSIKMGNFDYAERFPDSPNLRTFGIAPQDVTVADLTEKWLSLKEMEIASSTLGRYESVLKQMVARLGGHRLVADITQEDVLVARKDLMTGYHSPADGKKTIAKGRRVSTVNYYMVIMSGVFKFAVDNGYIEKNPFSSVPLLKRSRQPPDPLTKDEFIRLIDACFQRQHKNLWALAVYTGMRHGELCGLAWEDIDLKKGTLMVRRNRTKLNEFTLPKTLASTDRVIHLIQPAIDALKDQAELTRLGKQHQIKVMTREYGHSITQPCTFVFNPKLNDKTHRAGDCFSVNSISNVWDAAMRRAGIRHRKAYQSRHTYACWSLSVGANPSFIAAQMGHADAQMVFQVYGAWMPDNNALQVEILNKQLSDYAPHMPHTAVMTG
ncbi:tyrosine-type recombinase/integrase [Kluyvera sp. Awk 3]|uniref:tyrosine-type recombinase/integrase n=1 Tax=Kluyvera sp. Awk 3 TaxID=2963956 RepID=UPI0023026BEA|nr:site-specific integrase [Kluyvera sp. Awk 3]MDA8489662.1 site-specific integrase [Kluyvera sp. Awk 3]